MSFVCSWRRVISTALAVVFTASAASAIPLGMSNRVCGEEHHACANQTLAIECCTSAAISTAALPTFVETWSSVSKRHVESMSWADGPTGVSPTVAARITTGALLGGSGTPAVPASDPPTILRV